MEAKATTIPVNQEKRKINKKQIFVGQGNNEELIKSCFQDETKWVIHNNKIMTNVGFYFKWVQCLKDIDYSKFKEGTQIVNHIQNIKIIASKTGLHQTLNDFEQREGGNKVSGLKLLEFYPQTYLLDLNTHDLSSDEFAFQKADENAIWIYKPAAMNCGKGITLITDLHKFKEDFFGAKKHYNFMAQNKTVANRPNPRRFSTKQALPIISTKFAIQQGNEKKSTSTDVQRRKREKTEENTKENGKNDKPYSLLKRGVIQKYLERPLLLDGKKFDYRCYCFVASTKPLLVLFHRGYLRLSMNKYNMAKMEDEDNRFTHLTNASVQKKHPDFKKEKENTIWSLEKFEEYIRENFKVSREKFEEIYHKIKLIFTHVFMSCEKKLAKRTGTFELLGCDILFDEKLTPYLLEMNANPAIFTDTKTQTEVIPNVVKSAISIVLKLNEKPALIGDLLKNIESMELFGFEVLLNEATSYIYR